ncbi:hypothetical protein F0562_008245 [Nyssa sinensis]|uniref:Uncharacterized protein n=1 Tax=Nyssa sinensis TaxID=561372 RepID=A0A5J5A9I3_9ASTE|nr:hypothetical protein F0562_008245 [Nyssa sinensis]
MKYLFTTKQSLNPVTWHRFGSPDLDDADEDAGSHFISAVCWKSDSPTMVAANSRGTIKVLKSPSMDKYMGQGLAKLKVLRISCDLIDAWRSCELHLPIIS